MSIEFLKKLPTPKEIMEQYPFPEELAKLKEDRDAQIRKVFTGEDDRFLAIIGPCSADSLDSVCDYLERLARVQEKVKEKVLVIPRVYTNKPRTTGDGYKGMVHQPDPEKKEDLLGGLVAVRQMHIKAVSVSGMTCADEMLYPDNWQYLADILSYVAVGARSVENQEHRLVSSGIPVPVGMKNPTGGDLSVMMNSIHAAQHAHQFIYRNWEVNSTGNELCHAIMRGSVNKHGQCIPNYHYEDLLNLLQLYKARPNLKYPACIVDANHANSDKKYHEQIRIVKEVIHSRNHNEEIKQLVKGVMVESYLVEGAQKTGTGSHVYGQSITDPCLGWDDTEYLLQTMAEKML